MFIIQGVNYTHPNRDLLFADLQFTVNTHEKIALVGNNGAGKSTLLKLMAGILHPSQGSVKTDSSPYYMPQLYGQLNDHTVAEALQVAGKIAALRSILDGQATEENFSLLDDDWTIEEKCKQAFSHWNLNGFDPDQKMATLSGGQKTKVLLAGITIHQPEIVLLDEPSNHLDAAGRELLYEFIRNTSATLVVVSHDRT
ncbi:MAG: ABC-F family ATP-binding cassette domain-containing protein, partial [Chitinophagaceae bacterium]